MSRATWPPRRWSSATSLDGVESISDDAPLPFSLRTELEVRVTGPQLTEGPHTIATEFTCEPFGVLEFEAVDYIVQPPAGRPHIPRREDDWSPEAVRERQDFVRETTGVTLEHAARISYDTEITRGNIEHLIGAAQVPLGIAGPLLINGEHAHGEYLIPLATTEGTLVASYNRGMKVLNAAGGVTCTVQDDSMQRAPVFIFDSAREALAFAHWLQQHLAKIAEIAESTTSVGKLLRIETYLAHRFAFCRFDFTTGDAAGQNMVSKATFAAVSWIVAERPEIRHFYLESNFATDKKASLVNVMQTRGKRVTAEALIPRQVLGKVMRVTPEALVRHSSVANVGAFLSGAVNNGLQASNGITALFIACGQDAANVAESSAAVIHSRSRRRRPLCGDHAAVPDRGHARRRDVPAHAGGVPGPAGLHRRREGECPGRDRGRDGAGRRDLACVGDIGSRLGQRPRAVRPQPVALGDVTAHVWAVGLSMSGAWDGRTGLPGRRSTATAPGAPP